MADTEQIECDAAVFIVQSGIQDATIIQEFKELTETSSKPLPLCIILNGGNISSDYSDRLVRVLTSAFPSMKQESVVITSAPIPVQGGFAIKRILDSYKVSDFVVFSTEDDLAMLLVVMDIIFMSAYRVKVKVYGDLYVNVPTVLTKIGEDAKSVIEKKCSEYLAELTIEPHEKLEVVKSDVICSNTFVHGFSTRKGGCSSYPSVAALNLAFIPSKKDPLIAVEENRHRLLKLVGAPTHRFELAKAVHGNSVWIVGTPQPPGYDAIVCDKPGVVIAAPAADCVTIVLADAKRLVCAAVHSGWKGTLANVVGATIAIMTEQFGCSIEDIRAAIGPSIGPCCYEVGMDVEKLFLDNPLLSQCIEAVQGKAKKHLNLQKALRLQLEDVGASSYHIDDSPSKLCTRCNEDMFYSYRRDGRPFGTHVGFIGLRAAY